MNLPYYLECVCKTTGKNAGIKYREAAGKDILYVRCLEHEHEKHSHSPGDKELQASQLYTLGAGGKVTDRKNMECKGKGTEKNIEVSLLQHKLLAHAQKVETADGQEHGGPQRFAYTLSYEKPQAWDKNYVERCDEAGLPCAGILDAHLLQVGGKAKQKATYQAAGQQNLALLAFLRQHGSALAENRDKWNKEKTADKCPYGVESKRFHIGHSYPLGNKSRAPYESCEKKQKAAGQFLVFHIRQIIKNILVCKYFFCYIVDE